jgi:lipopolysaccharide/colanic/teichoic acid biosynthesis glycosyltransferase
MTAAGFVAKRVFDFVLSVFGILCLLPLFVVVALLIKVDSTGPVFFRQKRMGYGGRLFEIFKFRTMVTGAHEMGSRLTVKRDPRITRLGKILRWSKIDELPQLLNVLRGDMSVIGPRPEDPHFGKFYTAEQMQVLALRPGMLGPSQILGRDEIEDYPEGLKDTEAHYVDHILPPKLARDLDYVSSATFRGDVRLLAHGLWVTVRGAFRARYLWRRRGKIMLLGVDLLVCLAAYVLAVLVRFEGAWPAAVYTWQTLAIIGLLRPPVLAYFGAYHHMVSHFGVWDLFALFKAVSAGSIAVAGLTYFAGSQSHPRSVFLIDWALVLFMLAAFRYGLRAWARRHPGRNMHHREKVIIVGAGNGGAHLSRALLEDPASNYYPIGFIDESHESWGARIHGVRVLGGAAELRLALSANNVRTVFTCLADLGRDTAKEVAEICAAAGVDCHMIPTLDDLLRAESGKREHAAAATERRVGRAV